MATAYAQIVGWGRYVPTKILTNHDLALMVDTTDDWIRTRTGITERRIAAPKETSATMGARAAMAALEVANLNPSRLDLIICATITPDYLLASTAALIQDAIGASRAGAFDLNAGCSGFVYALSVATQYIQSGTARHVLVVGAETVSRIIDWSDRVTCVLFGDGAGAIVLSASERPTGVLHCILGSDGSGAESLYIPAGGSRLPASAETVQAKQHFVKMDGHEVYRFAVTAMTQAATQAIAGAGLKSDDIDLFIPHQANVRIIQSAARALKLPMERVFVNVDRYGNTSSASIPIALCEAIEQGRVRQGDRLVLVGFGAGLSWAGAVVQWGVPTTLAHRPWWRGLLQRIWGQQAIIWSASRRARRRLSAVRVTPVRPDDEGDGT
jgi:3-oxoacyl-[acyl-carrier-protein] synthase III